MGFTSEDLKTVLAENWGYDSFRPKQEDIIMSVLDGHDTLGLMPTGGGKSITFQVPALLIDGLTLVVTPLISLMKDQVDNLRTKGIQALYLFSGLTLHEQRLAIEKCRYGKCKILYLSPEKLVSPSFIATVRELPVKFIVVDEAHCISQWGYDFRPSYLKIRQLRDAFPDVPVLALTATATPEVADDIVKQLDFRRGYRRFTLSFRRDNISFIVRRVENKDSMLVRVVSSVAGPAIVYVRSRKRTREIAQLLIDSGISAEYYHAGLSAEDKNDRQNRWKHDKTRIMVATNAFGMGIDKADVRLVVHYDLPSSLEEYYQEAGRAGRDGNHSFAVVLASVSDKGLLTRRLNESFPPKETVRKVYELAGNFLDIAVGEGYNRVYEFNFNLFCKRFDIKPVVAHNSLMIMSRSGYVDFSEEVATRSRIMIVMDRDELYSLHLSPVTDNVFQHILRSYTGLFADYEFISESHIAFCLRVSEQQVYESLLALSKMRVINYVPRKTTPYLYYITAREEPRHLIISREAYEHRRARMERRIEAMKNFVFSTDRCRVSFMLEYFGEKAVESCGRCDYCRSVAAVKVSRESIPASQFASIVMDYLSANGSCSIDTLADAVAGSSQLRRDAFVEAVRTLADEQRLKVSGITVELLK